MRFAIILIRNLTFLNAYFNAFENRSVALVLLKLAKQILEKLEV